MTWQCSLYYPGVVQPYDEAVQLPDVLRCTCTSGNIHMHTGHSLTIRSLMSDPSAGISRAMSSSRESRISS
jgi:hypothetical protein